MKRIKTRAIEKFKQASSYTAQAQWVILVLLLSVVIIGFIAGYEYRFMMTLSKRNTILSQEITNLTSHIQSLESQFASTTVVLKENITQTQNSFTTALQKEKQNVTAIQEQFGTFKEEVGEISGTVITLEKLSNIDPELLQKYSKIFFLNEHYSPARLVEIPNEYKYSERRTLQIHERVWPHLESMLSQALTEEVEIYIFSAFRSFNTQTAIKNQYAIVYGEGTANQFSADQGYSEHQLGTTVDLITTGIGGTLSGFEKTDSYKWLLENAHKYGFVLSYPKDNSFYIFEPWHWRFVGVALATKLHNTGKNFYDLDQREIDTYLVSLFD